MYEILGQLVIEVPTPQLFLSEAQEGGIEHS